MFGASNGILFFFFNDTATTEIYTLSLHDALPILGVPSGVRAWMWIITPPSSTIRLRSEEHTSELQSPVHIVCRLLLEKKQHHTNQILPTKKKKKNNKNKNQYLT